MEPIHQKSKPRAAEKPAAAFGKFKNLLDWPLIATVGTLALCATMVFTAANMAKKEAGHLTPVRPLHEMLKGPQEPLTDNYARYISGNKKHL